jgi:O-antigen/teichoic acid export membrane protein
VGLIVLGITIVQLAANLINGSIVYYSSRIKRGNLLFISYFWSIASVFLFIAFNEIVEIFDAEYAFHIYLLSFLQSIFSIHLYLILGDEKIRSFNILSLLQSIVTIAFLLIAFFVFEKAEVMSFVYALYLSYSFVAIISGLMVISKFKEFKPSEILQDFRKTIQYGFFIQTANTFQLLNYRLSYFVLDAFAGRAALGQYAASIQLSESLLIPGRSIATVQYARISTKNNDNYAQRITFLFMKISFLVTLLGTVVMLILPTSLYQFILGDAFAEVKILIICMALGLVALSAEIILSHYFSGTGRQKTNSISAAIGLATTIAGCFILIPTYGAVGAAITTAVSYGSMFGFLFIMMNFQKGVSSVQFIPNREDMKLLKRIWRKRGLRFEV